MPGRMTLRRVGRSRPQRPAAAVLNAVALLLMALVLVSPGWTFQVFGAMDASPPRRREAMGAVINAVAGTVALGPADPAAAEEMPALVPLSAVPLLTPVPRAPVPGAPGAAATPPPAAASGPAAPAVPSLAVGDGSGPPLRFVQGKKGDFIVGVPVPWQTQFDDYAGRLVLSFDFAGGTSNFTSLRVARLTLPSLLKSARYVPREGDEMRGKWEEVALGNVTAATIAEWIMRAGQKEVQGALNIVVQDAQIKPDGKAREGSELTWHATTTLIPLDEKALMNPPPPRITTGKALLRAGVATFVVVEGSKERFDQGLAGYGRKYLDSVRDTLTLDVDLGRF
mmetsp:Transcript_124542/g.278502  ORF Transcript_124542/g.278502 Transcript_124542/m.278502 type:complete len:339 (-) Transcript_124542:72-1088(-)